MDNIIVIIDVNSILYRNFYAIKFLNYKEKPVNAIFGFIKSILKLIKEIKPMYLIFTFDKGKITFRNEISKDYKANRKAMPDKLLSQIPITKEFIKSIKSNYIEIENFEADDCIASIINQMPKQKIYIFTSDSDLYTLINENVKIINPKDFKIIDKFYIKEKFNLNPKQLLDYKILKGDSSDNIKGIPYIGHKTAIKLLSKYNNIKNIYENINQIIPEKIKQSLKENINLIEKNKELIKLKNNLNIEIRLQDFKFDLYNKDFYNFLDKYNFKSIKSEIEKIKEKKVKQQNIF